MISFDRAAETYDATREAARPEVMDALARELEGCRSTLEVGIGTGRLARPLIERGVPVVGVDISRRMLDVAVGKGVGQVIVGEACRLPFARSAFDGVLAVHVMHLVDDLAALLSEVRRVSRRLLATLAYRWDPADNPSDAYTEALIARGYRPRISRQRPEWLLAEIMPPATCRRALTTELTGDWDPMVDSLERRDFAISWDAPDDLHSAAVSETRRRYTGPRPPTRHEVFVLAWDLAVLTDDALRQVQERICAGA